MVLYGPDQATLSAMQNQAWPSKDRAPSGTQPGYEGERWGGTTHRVVLKGLQPHTTYYYAVRSSAAKGTGTMSTGNILSFTTQ
jgi:hypothetical protein